jgi:hypothetical protein
MIIAIVPEATLLGALEAGPSTGRAPVFPVLESPKELVAGLLSGDALACVCALVVAKTTFVGRNVAVPHAVCLYFSCGKQCVDYVEWFDHYG